MNIIPITKEQIDTAIEIIEEMEDTEDESMSSESVVEYMLGLGHNIPDAHRALGIALGVMTYNELTTEVTQTV